MFTNKSNIRSYSLIISLSFCLCLSVNGCVNKQISSAPDTQNALSLQRQEQVNDLTQITDGILHCLATYKYQWLKNYTHTELSGLQVARLLLGDAAFDRVIVGWNTQLLTATFNDQGDAVIISIPVTHQPREDIKFGQVTSVFNFHYYFSSQHGRWLLNFNQLLMQE